MGEFLRKVDGFYDQTVLRNKVRQYLLAQHSTMWGKAFMVLDGNEDGAADWFLGEIVKLAEFIHKDAPTDRIEFDATGKTWGLE